MRRYLPAVLMALAVAAPLRAPAVSPGCTAAGLNQNTTPISCEYRATGAGRYVATTAWPYQISASSDGGYTWRALVAETGFGHPSAGSLLTRRGDIVRVQIGCWNDGRACLGYCPPGPAQVLNCYYEGSRAGAVTALNT